MTNHSIMTIFTYSLFGFSTYLMCYIKPTVPNQTVLHMFMLIVPKYRIKFRKIMINQYQQCTENTR